MAGLLACGFSCSGQPSQLLSSPEVDRTCSQWHLAPETRRSQLRGQPRPCRLSGPPGSLLTLNAQSAQRTIQKTLAVLKHKVKTFVCLLGGNRLRRETRQLESRVRENRTHGSEGGEGYTLPDPYR